VRLPKFAARWVDKQIKIADDAHSAHCRVFGVSPDEVDPPESWREKLHYWFPLEIVDGSWQRAIDWTEIVDTFAIPLHRRLRLCKLGWHMWGCYYEGHSALRYQDAHANCTNCGEKRYGWVPRWAR
jgi:hypothetical protein